MARRCFQIVKTAKPRRRWLFIGSNHQINKIGEFLQFSSKGKGIRVWNFRMMIRKIWRFLWYQNRNDFDKMKKKLGPCIFNVN